MALYYFFNLKTESQLLKHLPRIRPTVLRGKSGNLELYFKDDFLHISGNHRVEIPLRNENESFYGEIFIDAIISKAKFTYLIIGISGPGLFGRGNPSGYVKHSVQNPCIQYLEKELDLLIDSQKIKFRNEHFSEIYWGETIKTRCVQKKNHLRMKVSARNLPEIIKEDDHLSRELDIENKKVTYEFIEGYNKKLEHIEGGNLFPERLSCQNMVF